MKKILMVSAILSCMILMSSLVLAVSQEQGVNAAIAETISLIITPANLEFGEIIQGSTENVKPITFTAGAGANVNMNIEFTSVTKNGLFELMELETSTGIFTKITDKPAVSMPCTVIDNVCTYTARSINAKLKVPAGYPAGTKTGVITYTITGPAPISI